MDEVPPSATRVRGLWLAAALALVLATGAITTLLVVRPNVAGEPSAAADVPEHCIARLYLTFKEAAAYQPAAEALRHDKRVKAVEAETQEQAWERFKQIFANDKELLELTRLESMQWSARVLPADGVAPNALAGQFRTEFPATNKIMIMPERWCSPEILALAGPG